MIVFFQCFLSVLLPCTLYSVFYTSIDNNNWFSFWFFHCYGQWLLCHILSGVLELLSYVLEFQINLIFSDLEQYPTWEVRRWLHSANFFCSFKVQLPGFAAYRKLEKLWIIFYYSFAYVLNLKKKNTNEFFNQKLIKYTVSFFVANVCIKIVFNMKQNWFTKNWKLFTWKFTLNFGLFIIHLASAEYLISCDVWFGSTALRHLNVAKEIKRERAYLWTQQDLGDKR